MLKKILIFICLSFCLFLHPLKAEADIITCDYDKAGLSFTYEDANPTPKITSDFISNKKYFNFLGIIESGKNETATQHIDMNQEWYAKYHETPCACPTKLYVCTQTLYSWNLPTLNGIGGTIFVNVLQVLDTAASVIDKAGDLLSNVCAFGYCLDTSGWDLSSLITDDLISEIGEHAYSRFTLNQRDLYIMTKEEYDRSELSDKEEGVRVFNESIDLYMDNLEYRCGDDGCEFWSWDVIKYMFAYFETYWETILKVFTEDELVFLGVEEIECRTIEYSGECDTFDVNCDFFVDDEVDYKNLITEYNNCKNDSSCEASVLSKIHNLQDIIDAKCDNVLKNYLYSEAQKECVKKCINLSLIFNEWSEGSELYTPDLGGDASNQCNLSTRVVAWLMKIIEWIRYIVPVLLIILSILEFIKAIASDSEDEIRKVGARFVKRLIVAAIIFVLPLLLEFLLGIFNIPIKDYCLK